MRKEAAPRPLKRKQQRPQPGAGTPDQGLGKPLTHLGVHPMSKTTELASVQLSTVDMLVIELVENDERTAAVIIRWPVRPGVFNAKQFGPVATQVTTAFAGATVRLAQIRRDRKL
jgi:hypothetical protein